MFLGPLMLLNGMLPEVAQATNSAAIMLSSSSAVIYSLYSKVVPWEEGAILYGVSCLSGFTGKIVVNRIVSLTKRHKAMLPCSLSNSDALLRDVFFCCGL